MQRCSWIGVFLFVLGCGEGSLSTEAPVAETRQELLGCSGDQQCSGGLACDIGQCLLGQCIYLPILGCTSPEDPEPPLPGLECSSNLDCGVNVGCNLDVCILGTCVHADLLGCSEPGLGCTTHAECESASPLGIGLCLDGGCVLSVGVGNADDDVPGVDLLCDADADCNDGDPCTADVCASALGLCAHVPLPGCTPSADDGDGAGSGGSSSSSGGTGHDDPAGDGTGAGGTADNGDGNDDPAGDGTGAGGTAADGDGAGRGSGDGPTHPDGAGGSGAASSGSGLEGDKDEGGSVYRGGGCSTSGQRANGTLLPWLIVCVAGLLWARRRRAGSLTASALFVGLLVPLLVSGPASAQGFSIDSNSVPLAPEDLLWTERAAIPMDHLSPFVRVMGAYASDPLVQEDLASGARTTVIESQSALYVSGGIALFDRFHLAAMVPLYVQSDGPGATTDLTGFSLGDPALEARMTLLDANAPFELGLAGTVTLPVGDSDQLVSDEAVSGNPRILLGKSWGEDHRSFVALNGGVRFRRASTLGDVTAGHELTFGAGVNWAFWGPLAAVVELGGRTTFDSVLSERVTPLGGLLGLRWAPGSYSLAAGAGPGLNEGVGSPKVRVLATGGVRWRAAPRQEQPYQEQPPAEPARPVEVARAPDPVAEDPCRSEQDADPSLCPHLDADGDSIPNGRDACPLEPEDFDGFQDDDGCPDPDNDGDGIPDAEDRCPMDAETFNGIDDEDGCPDKVRVQDGQIATLEPIFFETNSTKIQERSEPLLAEIAQVISARADIGVVSIEGHTDSRGSDAYNLELSRGRAESVRQFLIDAGVPANRLVARGFGESRPIVPGDTPAAHATNRRVEFRLNPASEPVIDEGGM